MKFRTKLTASLLALAMLIGIVICTSSCNKANIPNKTESSTTAAVETTAAIASELDIFN